MLVVVWLDWGEETARCSKGFERPSLSLATDQGLLQVLRTIAAAGGAVAAGCDAAAVAAAAGIAVLRLRLSVGSTRYSLRGQNYSNH